MFFEFFFVIIVGLTFGSFVTLASYRLPQGDDIVLKPSQCPKCGTQLTFPDLWPVLSWVISRGKCRHCKTRVSVRYPLTEIATAVMFGIVYLKFGLMSQGVWLALLWVVLMVMIVIDLEHYIIPDQLHYILLPMGLAYQHYLRSAWGDVFRGVVLSGGIGLLLHYGYRWLRGKEGLGFGDVKFLAIAGIWLGFRPIIPFLFFSGLFGVATGLMWRALGKGVLFPFGPALALSMYLCLLLPQITNLFWNIGQLAR